MQKHITRYATEAAYDSDFDNLDFPNVSYIDEGDEVRYMEEHPYLITGKSTATSPFTLTINGTSRTVTLDPDTGDWEINIKSYMPLTGLYQFASGKSSIKSIDFPKSFDVSNVTTIGSTFRDCSALTSVGDLSNWNVGNVSNMSSIFFYCSKLTSVGDLSNWNVGNVTTMNQMFYYCSALTTIEGLCAIGDGTNAVSTTNMFTQCRVLTTITACGDIHNTVSFPVSPLTLDSAKVILNALSTPYQGAQTLTFSTTTKGYINADSEALAIVADKQAIGWTIAL